MELVKDYIKQTNLVAHQIDTINHFYNVTVPKIVVGAEIVSQFTTLKFIETKWESPKITPKTAMEECKTYNAQLLIKTDKLDQFIPLCSIPVMIYSDLCIKEKEYGDPGGYFIIKGKERVLIPYMRSLHNKIYVTPLVKTKYLYIAEQRTMLDPNSSILTRVKCTETELVLSIPYLKTFINSGVLLRALSIKPDDIPLLKQTIFYGNTLSEFNAISQKEALEAISLSTGLAIDYVKNILSQELKSQFHVGNYIISQIGLFAWKLQLYLAKKIPNCDKDSLVNKRVDSPGMLMDYLFNGLFKIYTKSVAYSMTSPNMDLIQLISSKQIITNEILACFLTGNWVVRKKFGTSFTRMGMSQVLTAYNHPARLSHLRKVMHNIGTKGKNYTVRQLHGSHMGMFCPFETPEGDRVGLILNLAITTEISIESDPIPVFNLLKSYKYFIDCGDLHKNTCLIDPVLINGTLAGGVTTKNSGKYLHDWLVEKRELGEIDKKTTLVWNVCGRLLEIFTDEGRLLHPLYNVKKVPQTVMTNWTDAVERQIIVFRASEEITTQHIALNIKDCDTGKFNLSEIFLPMTMTDVMAGLVPFANHTQSPRVIYQASMGKQAMGLPCISYRERHDTTLNVLNYPQKQLTKTLLYDPILSQDFPSGMMPIVAICTMGGFNQEDSILLNKSSIERGLFHSTTYKTLTFELQKKTKTEILCIPDDKYKRREYNYGYLDETGIINATLARGKWLKKGVVIIGKKWIQTGKCSSIVLKSYEHGMLDSVKVIQDSGVVNLIVHVRLRLHRIPEIGDKFASFTAQKGTCGMIVPQEDMPFDKDGIVPDLIINPHAFPSRMTINYLIQMCCDLFNCVPQQSYPKVMEIDASMFQETPIDVLLADLLRKMGADSFDSVLYNGLTGKKYPTKIFIGPCPYQRLKHLVSEKVYSRVTGPLEILTRQPVAGRRRYGGLKTGEMERDCNISHGASMVLREVMFDKSDKYKVALCNDCEFGLMEVDVKYCQNCDNTNLRIVNIPYTTKLLFQELQAVGIKLNIT